MAAMQKDKSTEDLKARAIALAGLVTYQDGAIVSREIVTQPTGTVTAFAFDEGEQLSEHTAPFDAMVIDLDGEADIVIGGKPNRVKPGDVLFIGGKGHEMYQIVGSDVFPFDDRQVVREFFQS
mgnify:CR=1 FL=1